VESSTGTQLETLDSSAVPSNHYQGLQPETKDYITLPAGREIGWRVMGRSTVLQTPKDWIHPTSTLTLQFRINILLDHDFNYESFLFFSSIILFFSQNVPVNLFV